MNTEYEENSVDKRELLDKITCLKPRIHCFTPAVSANDTANLLLAIGASPILSDETEEAAEITENSKALSLSCGMPSNAKWEAMLVSSAAAKRKNLPVVLDLTGICVSRYRKIMSQNLIHSTHPNVLKGNASEIRSLLGYQTTGGIDASIKDTDRCEDASIFLSRLKDYARNNHCLLICTGKVDILTSFDGRQAFISGGSAWMSKISGTGCMLTAFIAAALTLEGYEAFSLVETALHIYKDWGEWAQKQLRENEGTASYKIHFIDAVICCR